MALLSRPTKLNIHTEKIYPGVFQRKERKIHCWPKLGLAENVEETLVGPPEEHVDFGAPEDLLRIKIRQLVLQTATLHPFLFSSLLLA